MAHSIEEKDVVTLSTDLPWYTDPALVLEFVTWFNNRPTVEIAPEKET